MHKLILISSLLFIWNGTTQNEEQPETSSLYENVGIVNDCHDNNGQVEEIEFDGDLDISYLDYVEEKKVIEMSPFLVYYLPANFDAYLGSTDNIKYVEEEEDIDLGFDTKEYLPKGFNARTLNLDSIAYIGGEEDVELGFDTREYLPKGFDPYLGSLETLKYIKMDDTMGLECDVNQIVTKI